MPLAERVVQRPGHIVGQALRPHFIIDGVLAAQRGIAFEILTHLGCTVLDFAGGTTDVFGSLPHLVVYPLNLGLAHPVDPHDPGAKPLRMVDHDMKRRPLDGNARPLEPDTELGENIVNEALIARVVCQPMHNIRIRGDRIDVWRRIHILFLTGEALLDRCPACLNLLGWTKLQHVWSCQICGFDLRSERPRYSPPETFAAADKLARYVIDRRVGLPPPLDDLPCLDILKLASWMAYFRGIPERLFLNVTAKGAAEGFAQLKRWPGSFDAIVVKLLGVSTSDDLAGGDVITRSAAAAGVLASIERLSSASAREVVKARLAEVLGLGKESIEAFHEVMEPVMAFDETKDHYFSPRMPAMASTRSSHERARSRPAGSRR
jgi:hypothetical protein